MRMGREESRRVGVVQNLCRHMILVGERGGWDGIVYMKTMTGSFEAVPSHTHLAFILV